MRQLLGCYPITEGTIKIDNQNLESFPKQALFNQVAFLGQQSFMFNGESLWDNLTLGLTFSYEEVAYYLKRFHLWEELGCEAGLDNIRVDENRLSGGQIQRLSLVRILLRGKKVIILDEVTSALDANNEERVVNLLNDIKNEHIIIQVSHKEQIIRQADSLLDLGG